MKNQSTQWKTIVGGLFIVLALAIYVYGFVAAGKQQALANEVAAKLQADPAVLNYLAPQSSLMVIVDNPPALVLLFVGIAWLWNTQKKLATWLYGILGVYFVVMSVFIFRSMYRVRQSSGFSEMMKSPEAATQFYAMAIAGGVMLVVAILFFWRASKARQQAKSGAAGISDLPKPVVRTAPHIRQKTSYALCNVIDAGPEARRIWQFDASRFALKGEQIKYAGEALPAKMVGKDWSSLFQHKLNIALLPSGDVFLRVVHLPMASLDETISMVELQLEKISPAPVAQVVWTLHVLPNAQEGMQTVLVVIASRNAVEEFLGKLEGQGYIADRLEVSFLEQLLTTNIIGNGAWIYPDGRGAKNSAVIAWWYGGILRSVNFIVLPTDGLKTENLHNQLRQMTWAGELDGWLTAPPAWHLVADESTRAVWEPLLHESVDAWLDMSAPLSPQEIAGLTARRAVANPTKVGLLPPEYAVRYRQQFRDRLWLRGLLAVGGLYCVGVLIYFAALYVLNVRADRVVNELTSISGNYTNAIELKARLVVLQDRADLKFAALDCWKAVSDQLPDTMTLDTMNFNDGQKLLLGGSFSGDANVVLDFSEGLRKVTNNAQSLFNQQAGDPFAITRGSSWTYNLELKRSEVTP